MKRFVCFLLCIIMIFSSVEVVFSAESEKYHTIYVEYSDRIGDLEALPVMIQNDNVYADAETLGKRLGYDVKVTDEYVSIYKNEYDEKVPFSGTLFYFDSIKVSHMVFLQMIDDYEAPFKTVKNESGVWIPFEYSLMILNSSFLELEDTICIDMPKKKIIDIFTDLLLYRQKYHFEWSKDIGYSEVDWTAIGAASHVVNLFNGLLEFEGESWIQFMQLVALDTSAYDAKYSSAIAKLFCTYSDKEYQKELDNMKLKLDYFNDNGKLGKVLESYSKDIPSDAQIGELQDVCNELLNNLEKNSDNLALYNQKYQMLETMCDQADFFDNSAGLVMDIQKEIDGATGGNGEKICIAFEVVGYANEFQKQDKFAIETLEYFIQNEDSQSSMSLAMKAGINASLYTIKQDVLSYSVYQYLMNNYGELASDAFGVSDVLGTQAMTVLLCWDLAKAINFLNINDKIEAADQFELAVYSTVFQAEAYFSHRDIRDNVLIKEKNYNSEELYKVTQSLYAYLKFCYISRNAAVASLKGKTKATQSQIEPLIRLQNDINGEIASYLVQLKSVGKTNKNGEYGFFPENNKEYLEQYRNRISDAIISRAESDIAENELKEILSQSVSEEILSFICDDFDNNGVWEAVAFCGKENTEEMGFWGTFYLVTYGDVAVIREYERYLDSGNVFQFDNQKIIAITQYYGTGMLTSFYKIEGKIAKELNGSGYGYGFQDEDGKIYIRDEWQYDSFVDGTGRTFNIYYFYWDGDIREYGGICIDEETFLKYRGAEEILGKIENDGYEVTSIFERQNGIININCCDGENNKNVRLLLNNGSVSYYPVSETSGYYESGIIKHALIPEIATYGTSASDSNDKESVVSEVREKIDLTQYSTEKGKGPIDLAEDVNSDEIIMVVWRNNCATAILYNHDSYQVEDEDLLVVYCPQNIYRVKNNMNKNSSVMLNNNFKYVGDYVKNLMLSDEGYTERIYYVTAEDGVEYEFTVYLSKK